MSLALIAIVGATATGKSDLALEIAKRLNAPILSADSRQVYQEFNIGTAKPSKADRKSAPHYLIDLCPPTQTLTVAEYQALAQSLIAKFQAQGQVPLLVGGTGLYVQSIVQGLKIPRVPPQRELRSQLETFAQSERHQWLQQVDPNAASKIHGNDAVRTLRALEVYYVTGVPLSQQQGSNPPPYPILQIGLEIPDKTIQTQFIRKRTIQMIELGWPEEVAQLIQKYGPKLPLLQTLGYAELLAYLANTVSLEDTIERIVTHTRQFAKRQRTWFRADAAIHWLDANDPNLTLKAWERVEIFLRSSLGSKPTHSAKDGCALLK
jgi:tRNA dimethylallyltransferase